MTRHFYTVIAAAIMGGVAFGASAQETVSVNMTSKVGTSQSAWNGSGTYNVNVTPEGGSSVKMVERYFGKTTSANGDAEENVYPLKQTVTGLPNGTYNVSIYATANACNGVITHEGDLTDAIKFYATSGDNTKETFVVAGTNSSFTTPGEYSIEGVTVTDGTLTLGLQRMYINSANWYTMQIKSLTRIVPAEEYANEAYQQAKTAAAEFLAAYPDASAETLKPIKDLVDASAPTTAAELEAAANALNEKLNDVTVKRAIIESNALAEGIEGSVNMSSVILNPDCATNTNNWTNLTPNNPAKLNIGRKDNTEGPVLSTGQLRTFFDGWTGQADWTISFQQLIQLPAGRYRLSALARSSAELRWLRLVAAPSVADNSMLSNGTTTSLPHADFARIGGNGGEFSNGWNMEYVDFEVKEENGKVCIAMQANTQQAGKWVGFTHFRLAQIEEYDLVALALESLTKAKDKATAFLAQYPDASTESIKAIQDLIDATAPATVDEINAAIEAINNVNLRRAVVESNAICAGIEGVVNYTNLIQNPAATEGTGNDYPGWKLAQADGGAKMEIYRAGAQNPTLADGSQPFYFNPANWGGNDWTISQEQTITLPAGKYRLSVLGRGSQNLSWLRLVESTEIPAEGEHLPNNTTTTLNHADIPHIEGDGGLFGRGWNMVYVDFEINEDNTPVCIAVQANAKQGKQWDSFTDFQLVKYADAAPVLPEIKVNGMTEDLADGGTLTNEAAVDVTFDVPEGVTLWYKWTPATTNLVAEAEDVDKYAGFTEYTGEPVHLEFQGTLQYYAQRGTARSAIKTVTVSVCTGIENVAVDAEEAAEYYNLNGVRVDASNLAKGIYIRRTANDTSKVIR